MNAKNGISLKPPRSLPGLILNEPKPGLFERLLHEGYALLGGVSGTMPKKLRPTAFDRAEELRRRTDTVDYEYQACSQLLDESLKEHLELHANLNQVRRKAETLERKIARKKERADQSTIDSAKHYRELLQKLTAEYDSSAAYQAVSSPILHRRMLELDEELHQLIAVQPVAYIRADIEASVAQVENLMRQSINSEGAKVLERMERKITEREKAVADFQLPEPDPTRPDYYPNIYARALKNVEKNEARAKAAVDALFSTPPLQLTDLNFVEVKELREKILRAKAIVDEACEVHRKLRHQCRDDCLQMDERISMWQERRKFALEQENEYLAEDASRRERACHSAIEVLRTHLKQIRLNSKASLVMQSKLNKSLQAVDKRLADAGA